jgi:fumarylacetoacetase
MIAHHTAGGCNLRPGDVLGSGTISGPLQEQMGSLLELSWGGSRDVQVGRARRTPQRAPG